jgi:redox-sensitive bicupin YhaK (pirin superfamily)
MKTIRLYKDLGKSDFGWLDSRHTFSFGQYRDPQWMGFGPLRVINNDRVEGGAGFSPHSHANMEIISYVMDGGLAHGDSLGTKSVIPAGNVQLMSAGSGITHSEFNASEDKSVHFYQIWIIPDVVNEKPGYQEMKLDRIDAKNKLARIVTQDGANDTLKIKSDAALSLGRFDAGAAIPLPATKGRKAWVQVTRGSITLDGQTFEAGDGVGISDEAAQNAKAAQDAEVLVFDMAA